MKRIAIIVIASAALTACSSDVNVDRASNPGSCAQERTSKFLGITYSRSQNIVTCAGSR